MVTMDIYLNIDQEMMSKTNFKKSAIVETKLVC